MSWSTSSTDVPRDLVEWLAAGRVGRPHGLDGSFHVTRPRGALLALGSTVRVGDAEAEIVRRAGTDERPILRLAGHEDREAADALRGRDLLVPLVRDAVRSVDIAAGVVDVDLSFLGEGESAPSAPAPTPSDARRS